MQDTTAVNDAAPGEQTSPQEAAERFLPSQFLTEELLRQGASVAQSRSWALGIDPRAETEETEEARMFFTNRVLRLYMSEQTGRNHMDARMLVTDGLSVDEWKAIAVKGIVPWLLDKLPVSKAQMAQAARTAQEHAEAELAKQQAQDVSVVTDVEAK